MHNVNPSTYLYLLLGTKFNATGCSFERHLLYRGLAKAKVCVTGSLSLCVWPVKESTLLFHLDTCE